MASDNRKEISIRFNGKEVSDPAALPPEIRKMIEEAEDKLTHGLSRTGAQGDATVEAVEVASTAKSYKIDGKTCRSLEEVPAPLRAKLEEAFKHAADGTGETIERIEISRQAFKSLDEMSPELRAAAQSMLTSSSAHAHHPSPPTRAVDPAAPSVSVEERRATSSWPALLLAMLTGALVTYLLLRH